MLFGSVLQRLPGNRISTNFATLAGSHLHLTHEFQMSPSATRHGLQVPISGRRRLPLHQRNWLVYLRTQHAMYIWLAESILFYGYFSTFKKIKFAIRNKIWKFFCTILFGMCSFRISAKILTILAEVFRGFSQCLQENSGMIQSLSSKSFPIFHFPVIVPFEDVHRTKKEKANAFFLIARYIVRSRSYIDPLVAFLLRNTCNLKRNKERNNKILIRGLRYLN